MKKIVNILPSILNANFAELRKEIEAVTEAGATILHLDIMDGHFVPNISFGPSVIKTINSFSSLTLDTHLMISNPDGYLEIFKSSGSDILTVHIEVCKDLRTTVAKIKDLGMKAGVAVNPSTPIQELSEILPFIDVALVMSVNPGFGGQKFIPQTIGKITQLKDMISKNNLTTIIEVDGGIDATSINQVMKAGAQYFVAGNAIFGGGNVIQNYRNLNKLI